MFKQKNGITLVALIITLILILLLAGVIVLIVQNAQLLSKSQSSVNKYKEIQSYELALLNEYETQIELATTRETFSLDKVYPIGSIYISVSETNPSNLFGGTWEQISSGRVLQGVSGNQTAGTTLKAGLPNITGYFWASNNVQAGTDPSTGAFQAVNRWRSQYINKPSSADWDVIPDYNFDASRSNSIYGASSTVQPPAYLVYMWQRTE